MGFRDGVERAGFYEPLALNTASIAPCTGLWGVGAGLLPLGA